MTEDFMIILAEGIDYVVNTQEQFRRAIFQNFCLLSWLTPDYEIRVIDEIIIDESLKVKIYKKNQDLRQFYSVQRKYDQENSIIYSMGSYQGYHTDTSEKQIRQKVQQNQAIKVEFSNNNQDNVLIKIICKNNVNFGFSFSQIFFKRRQQNSEDFNYFKPACRKPSQSHLSVRDIEYYFIEPESRRYCEPEGYHLNLAFQGGGAKGVSYVGVKRAINKLQQRIVRDSKGKIQLPIKSVIGSSAGGILSLAISAGIKDDDLTDICYMMDSLIEDQLFPVQDLSENNLNQINQIYSQNIKPSYFSNQQTAFKNTLHNLGLVQDSLSKILFETLKQPSVQQKLYALFEAFNPSVAALLSFKQPHQLGEGQSINNCCGTCCCCCYSNCWTFCGLYPCCKALPGSSYFIDSSNLKTPYRKLNIYGLLCLGLMTGDAVQNILAYALSLFLEQQAIMRSEKLCKLFRKQKQFNFANNQVIFTFVREQAKRLRYSKKLLFESPNNSNGSQKTKNKRLFENNRLLEYSKNLTLKQYYDLNGVEFTCTSVDLHDKIERFFNHKTTPDLPICKAVQMTGSFPVAFLSLKWQKQWGKYYIHYDRTRREIDLTDHHFTDGGLLANFPLKFLDNQKFREKYFSHKKVKGKTFLFGFGLDQLDDFPEEDKSQKISDCLSSLIQELKYRLLYKAIGSLISCGTKQTLSMKQNVKLFEFLTALMNSLRFSDRNLNKQCFKNQIIQTYITKRSIRNDQQLKHVQKQIVKTLSLIKDDCQNHFSKRREDLLNEEFICIYDRFYQFQKAYIEKHPQIHLRFNKQLNWQQIQQIKQKIQNSILTYSSRCIQFYHRKMAQLKNKYMRSDQFMTSTTLHHQYQILVLMYELKNQLILMPISEFEQIRNKMKDVSIQYYEQIVKKYQKILQQKTQLIYYRQKFPFMKQDQMVDLFNLKSRVTPFMVCSFKKLELTPHIVENKIEQTRKISNATPILNYEIEQQVFLNKKDVRMQIKNEVEQKQKQFVLLRQKQKIKAQTPKIHVILEASYFSNCYYPDYIKLVEEAIISKKLKIDIISCSSYHAVFGVLYAIGYDDVEIKKKMYEVKYLFEQNQQIEQIYESKQWMKTSIQELRTLLQRQWDHQKRPFRKVEQYYERPGPPPEINEEESDNLRNSFELNQQTINQSFQKVIDYISGSFFEVSKLPKQKRNERLEKLLSLGKYNDINKDTSQKGKRFFDNLLTKFTDLLMNAAEHAFRNQEIFFDNIFKDKEGQALGQDKKKEIIFKGMMIKSLIYTLKYKLFIYEILHKADLDFNITLSNFYQVCSKKILLNFNCINTTQQRFALINKITKPNMPVWAALMACASLPYLTTQFGSNQEWQNRQKGDRKMDVADKMFKYYQGDNINDKMNHFISGNAISSLPLQLMTNQRLINERLSQTEDDYIIQIAFAFDAQFEKVQSINPDSNSLVDYQYQQPILINQLAHKMEGKRKFINAWDIVKNACEYLFCITCRCNNGEFGPYFKDLIGRSTNLKMLFTRINSHDNFIISLYNDSLIKLPLRIGTLDFYKITKSRPDLQDTIRQAQCVVGQLCDIFQINKDQKSLTVVTPSTSTIQLSRHKCDVYNKQQQIWGRGKEFCRLKFISYTKWRDFKYKYIIEYSLNIKEVDPRKIEWLKVKDDYIDLNRFEFDGVNSQIRLKFTFFQERLVFRTYVLSMKDVLSRLQINKSRAIFQINYRQIYCRRYDAIVDETPVKNIVRIQSCFISKRSQYCSNQQCCVRQLDSVLINGQLLVCFSCRAQDERSQIGKSKKKCKQVQYNKKRPIAMKCRQCNSSYCLKCKINNFIAKTDISQKQLTKCIYLNPINKQNYKKGSTPILCKFLGENSVVVKNNCSLCLKYHNQLYHEVDITLGLKNQLFFSGLVLCQSCIYEGGQQINRQIQLIRK